MIQVILVFISSLIGYWTWKRFSTQSIKLPPGPIRWPILGSIPQMMMMASFAHLQFHGLAKKFGEVVSFGYGVHLAVVVSGYDAFKDIFRRTETNLERFTFDFLEERANHKNIGIIWSSGEEWKAQRKYTFKQLRHLGFGKKQSIGDVIEAEVNALTHDIQSEIESSGGIWAVKSNRLAACQVNVLWASVGGYRFDPNSVQIKRQLDIHYDIFEAIGPKNLTSAFPFLKIFPKWSGYKKIRDIQKTAHEFTAGLIEDAKRRRGDRVEAETFIETYLDEIEKQKLDPNPSMTEEQLVIILMDFFIAASDTSSLVLCWLLLYLGVYQEIQNKARSEITNFTGASNSPIPVTALAEMPYLYAIILETMRHAPFLPSSLPRRATEDFQYGEYTIPKGTCIFANYYTMFHDEGYWDDPYIFRPERLLTANGIIDTSKAEKITQFGAGARICPGEEMAMTIMFMLAAGIIRNFAFETVKVNGKEPSFDPIKNTIVLGPPPYSLKVRLLEK